MKGRGKNVPDVLSHVCVAQSKNLKKKATFNTNNKIPNTEQSKKYLSVVIIEKYIFIFKFHCGLQKV